VKLDQTKGAGTRYAISQHVFVIAEAGVNHNGEFELARRLVDVAVEAGADAVKFQTFKAEKLASRFAAMAEYQKKNTAKDESQVDMIKRLELSDDDHLRLQAYCRERGIMFFSTAFDLDSLDFLKSLGLDLFKIPSGEITNLPYLEKIARLAKDVILSTGMCDLADVQAAVQTLETAGLKRSAITVLHCNTEYPTPFHDVNLLAMPALGAALRTRFGYSDHTLGIEVPIAAVALGATVIEKHFTLDRTMSGPDHRASLEPAELKAMVRAIRHIESALGCVEKSPTASEIKNRAIARKSIVASRTIRQGEIFTAENLTTKRPGSGISPMRWYDVLGTKASRDYEEDELI
jgi:N,N'-diacetyllegionaminate synthase